MPYLAAPTDDVRALGILLHEVLTGGLPWRTPPRLFESLVGEMQHQAPRHPSDLNPDVPRELGDAAQRLLERDAYARPKDGAATLALLEPTVRTHPVPGCVPARPLPAMPSPKATETRRTPVPAAPAHPGRSLGLREWAASAAVVLTLLGIGYGTYLGTKEARRTANESSTTTAPTSPAPGPQCQEAGAKEEAPQKPDSVALPLPPGPLPGQMLPPCPRPYVEESGGCWRKFRTVTPDGKPAPCPSDNPYNREMKDENGQWQCYSAVIRPPKNTEKPLKGDP